MKDRIRPYLTAEEIISELKGVVGRTLVYRMLKTGEIPSKLVGSKKRIVPRAAFEAWIATCSNQTPSKAA